MRDPLSVAPNFPRFEASGNDLSCHGDPIQTRSSYMEFLAEAPIENTMATTLEAEYVFGTEDLESRVVKFAVIQGHQGEGAQEHELASFEAMMLPHMDAAHNLARWLLRNDQDA